MNPTSGFAALRELELWLNASLAEAEQLLPELLDLPMYELRRQLTGRPELRTAGVIKRLTEVAHDAMERFPCRAHELTSIIVEQAALIAVPESATMLSHQLQGQAWREHANAWRGLGNHQEAQRAVEAARSCFRRMPASDWHEATVDLIEAGILHDLGQHEEALILVRRAAALFGLHSDQEHSIEALVLEATMLWNAGNPGAAAEVWQTTIDAAQQRGDKILMARLGYRLGRFELRFGDPAEASRLFSSALPVLELSGLKAEATRARRGLAEATAARDHLNDAVSEYYKVRVALLAAGSIIEAALVSCEILALLLELDRQTELASLTGTLVYNFRDAGMHQGALEAFTYLRARSRAGELTIDDVVDVRRYFEDLSQRPYARYRPPE